MGAPSKRAKKIRKASEFDLPRLLVDLLAPKQTNGVHAWSLEAIKNARDDQLRGHFKMPARMAASMRTDDALFVAQHNRLAPQRALPVLMEPGKGTRAESVAHEADALYGAKGVALTPATLNDVNACLATHDVAFAACTPVPREDGSRIDVYVKPWPIEFVRWDVTDQCFKTQTRDGVDVPIIHGDGRWVIFQKHEHEPWKYGALLAAALVWARHALPLGDWMKGSKSHGNAKLVGEMPAGVPLQENGSASPEAKAFLDLLRTLFSGDLPIGIRPAGTKTEFVSNASTAWQVWLELVNNAEKAAARIYLGTDGILGAQGGAPGVDITALFGVAATIVEGDVQCIERGIRTGILEPWCALNFGDSSLTPTRKYLLPDADEDARHEARSKRETAFHAAIEKARANGFEITQTYVDELQKLYRVHVPALPKQAAKGPSIALAPTDVARVVSVNEARASAGLGPLKKPDGTDDPDGALTVEEYSAKKNAAVAPPAPSALRSVS